MGLWQFDWERPRAGSQTPKLVSGNPYTGTVCTCLQGDRRGMMGTVYVDVAPEVLRWATSRAGWDESTARKRAPKLDSWLTGERRPTFAQLKDFAHATHAPFGMLFLPEPPVETLPIPDMRTMRDVAIHTPSADLLDTIYICQWRQDWYHDYALDAGAEALDLVGSESLRADPLEVGARLRVLLDLDQRTVSSYVDARRDLIDRIEALGVLVMVSGIVGSNTRRKLNPQEFRGFTLVDDIAPLVFVNGADTKAAQIFTLAHELAHVTLGHSALSDVSLGVHGTKDEERWCNKVAAEVLVPMGAFRESFQENVQESELERLACQFKVSTLVILARARDAGYLSLNDYLSRYRDELDRVSLLAQEGGVTKGGNHYHTHPLRLGREFARAVINSAMEGTTTYRDA